MNKDREIQLLRKSNESLTNQVEELLEFKKSFFDLATSTTMSHEDFNVKDGLDFKEETELRLLKKQRESVKESGDIPEILEEVFEGFRKSNEILSNLSSIKQSKAS